MLRSPATLPHPDQGQAAPHTGLLTQSYHIWTLLSFTEQRHRRQPSHQHSRHGRRSRGCLIEVRIIGIIKAQQTEDGKTEANDRLLGVAIHSYDHQDLESIEDVSQTLLDQLEAFFISYNKQRGKKFKVTGTGGPKKAVRFLKDGMKAYVAEHPKP